MMEDVGRRRYIHTDISVDSRINTLAQRGGDFAVLFYTWAIPHADDDAILRGNEEEIMAKVIPLRRDKTPQDVAEVLTHIHELKMVVWDRANGAVYFPPETFYKYQAYISSEKRRKSQPEWVSLISANLRQSPPILAENGASPSPSPSPSLSPSPSKSSSSEVAENATTDKPKFDETSTPYQLALLLRNKCHEHHPSGLPKATVETMQKWALEMDRLIRLDEHPPDEVRTVIEWCQQDSFWYANIRSPDKLRKQYGQLALKMREGGGRAGRTTGKPEQITPEHQARIDKYAKRRRPDMPTGEV